jgi:hypothetical protein
MATDDATSHNIGHVLDAATAAIDAEFRRGERLEEKARGQATLAGSWFAVTQVVTATVVAPHAPKGWIVAWVILLLIQAVELCLLLRASARVWRLRGHQDIGPTSLAAMMRSVTDSQTDFAAHAIDFYGRVLVSAKAANQTRVDAFGGHPIRKGSIQKDFSTASFWWWPLLLTGLVEIAIALLSRVC